MKIDFIPTSKLHFDPRNPRFYKLHKILSDDETVSEMLEDEGIQELMLSIGAKNYFPGEPLLIIQNEEGEGDYIVMEGNRRLTAVKLLNGELPIPNRQRRSIERIIEQSEYKPENLPCVICDDKFEVTRYLGFRHVRGVKEWDSLSKAIYVQELLEQIKDDTYDNKIKSIAVEIGSNADYVSRLLSALKLYEAAKDSDFFGLKLKPNNIEFSLITTSLSYSDIREWLEIENLYDDVSNQVNHDHLKLMFMFLFVVRNNATTIISESRDLREFSHVVKSKEAMELLIETGDLEAAHYLTDGPSEALTNYLEKALKFLRHVWSELGEGRIQNVTDHQLQSAEEAVKRSNSIHDLMKKLNL